MERDGDEHIDSIHKHSTCPEMQTEGILIGPQGCATTMLHQTKGGHKTGVSILRKKTIPTYTDATAVAGLGRVGEKQDTMEYRIQHRAHFYRQGGPI